MDKIPLRSMAERDYRMIPVDKIQVVLSRTREKKQFDENVRSIDEVGLYKPILVNKARQKDKNARRPRFYPLLRLVLVDDDARRFAVERVCFTGDSGWMRLEILPLTAAMMRYLPHLGKDSFFSLL